MKPDSKISDFSLKREWQFLIFIAAFVTFLMWPFTMQGKALMPDVWKSIHPWARGMDINTVHTNMYDSVLEYGPWFEYSQQCLKERRIPHWNPWQFCGAPLYANRLIPFFYPPFILAELVASPQMIIAWFQFFNLIISGWGMFLLLRRWQLQPLTAFAGTCMYLTCGIHFLPYPVWTLGTTGFPWLLWSLEGFLQYKSVRHIALAVIIYGLILSVGYPVMVVHLSYFTAIFFILRWHIIHRTISVIKNWFIPLIALVAVAAGGLGLSAVANLPAYVYSKHTVRQVQNPDDKILASQTDVLEANIKKLTKEAPGARLKRLSDILLPVEKWNTRRWHYGGAFLYLFALMGAFCGRPVSRTLSFLWLAFSLVFIFPEIYILLTRILPGWSMTVLLPVEVMNLCACFLASFGIEEFVSKQNKRTFIMKIIFVILIISASLLAFKIYSNIAISESSSSSYMSFYQLFLLTLGVLVLVVGIIHLLPYKVILIRWLAVAGVICLSAGTFLFLNRNMYSSRYFMPDTPFTNWISTLTASHAKDTQGNRLARLWEVNPDIVARFKPVKSPFIPNVHMKYQINDIGGYDSLVPERYIKFINLLEDSFLSYHALLAFHNPSTFMNKRIGDLGIRWVITQGVTDPMTLGNLNLVWDERFNSAQSGTDSEDDFIQLWEVKNPGPRIFLTRSAEYQNGSYDEIADRMKELSSAGSPTVIIEDPSQPPGSSAFIDSFSSGESLNFIEGSSIIIKKESPEYLELDVTSPEDCFLILRDTCYPEWHAFVDDAETKIYPADLAFRAIRIPAGKHKVIFKYIPSSFYLGAGVSLITLLILIASWIYTSGGKTRYIKPTALNL